ncbi:hypothetical protein SLEP1_g2190 [Rubroshorea leprosula]|uniref:Uncharacterized protein n=1 Tax=Rubroshorea leprosula TaxID=152421 RepID=A0AAV5HQ31_9ROSI|nr:hypothetical protein SLEP1_g2190 [Rubroshorea leprosula]
MATAFSTAKFGTQLFPLGTTSSRSHQKPVFDPLKTPACSFLGSTCKLRLTPASKLNQVNSHRRSPVVAVSDVVKEKKTKSASNLVFFSNPFISF